MKASLRSVRLALTQLYNLPVLTSILLKSRGYSDCTNPPQITVSASWARPSDGQSSRTAKITAMKAEALYEWYSMVTSASGEWRSVLSIQQCPASGCRQTLFSPCLWTTVLSGDGSHCYNKTGKGKNTT